MQALPPILIVVLTEDYSIIYMLFFSSQSGVHMHETLHKNIGGSLAGRHEFN